MKAAEKKLRQDFLSFVELDPVDSFLVSIDRSIDPCRAWPMNVYGKNLCLHTTHMYIRTRVVCTQKYQ